MREKIVVITNMINYLEEELIEDIRNSNDIIDVVSEYIKIDKKGKDYFGLCPFHKEKTPSFSVAPGKQIYYCFGCGKGGNVINFIKEIENLDFLEAVKLLAERAKIILPEGDDEKEIERGQEKRRLLSLNKHAAKFFYNSLNSTKGKIAFEYLKKRGIEKEIINKFGLGYSFNDFNSLVIDLKKKGFTKEEILKTGLALKNKKGELYQRFRDRIIFPIIDLRNNVIGFGGRVITKEGHPKYMNSPQSPVYDKSRSLYSLNLAKSEVDGTLIIVEGYMDTIALYKSGFRNVAATLGTAMTINQARILKKYVEEVIIAYDMDSAGRKAALRGIDILEQVGLKIKVLELTDGKDPDEFIGRYGIPAFNKAIMESKSFVEYKIGILRNNLKDDSPEERIKFIVSSAKVLTSLKSRVEREIYTKRIAKEYGISEEAIFSEINKYLSKDNKENKFDIKNRSRRKQENNENMRIVKIEMFILIMLGLNYNLFEHIKDKIKQKDFINDLSDLAENVFLIIVEGKENTPAEFINKIPDKYTGSVSKILKMLQEKGEIEKSFMEALSEREILYAESGKESVLRKLGDSSISDVERQALKEKYINYDRILKERKR